MIAGEKIVTSSGNEVMLFPMNCMYITQDEYGSLSHTLAMDFVGWNGSYQVKNYPYYAPCTCKCVAKNTTQAWLVWESLYPVVYANGTIDYICFVVMHDDSPTHVVGDIVYQGDLLGHTGSSGYATGDHMHLNVAQGKYAGWTTELRYNELKNSIHIYNACYVNDTTLYVTYGHPWLTYTQPTPPPPPPVKTGTNYWKYLYLIRKRIIKH